ncbi:MAG: acyl-ACP desaturase [Leptospirillum sp.]
MNLTLDVHTLRPLISDYNRLADDSDWNRFGLLDKQEIDSSLLTQGQKEAVIFVTHIENHTPTYISDYLSRFPIDGGRELKHSIHNRELFHFIIRWGLEEDRHAESLALYQLAAGIAPSTDKLLNDMIEESIKPFSIGFAEPVQVFTYTFLQEKATQLYYQCLSKAVSEPVLAHLLRQLAKDESRHFAFFSKILDAYLDAHGERAIDLILEVSLSYRMPLHNTLKDYRRRAILMSREAPGYHRKFPVGVLAEHLEHSAERHPQLSVPLHRASARMRAGMESPSPIANSLN